MNYVTVWILASKGTKEVLYTHTRTCIMIGCQPFLHCLHGWQRDCLAAGALQTVADTACPLFPRCVYDQRLCQLLDFLLHKLSLLFHFLRLKKNKRVRADSRPTSSK